MRENISPYTAIQSNVWLHFSVPLHFFQFLLFQMSPCVLCSFYNTINPVLMTILFQNHYIEKLLDQSENLEGLCGMVMDIWIIPMNFSQWNWRIGPISNNSLNQRPTGKISRTNLVLHWVNVIIFQQTAQVAWLPPPKFVVVLVRNSLSHSKQSSWLLTCWTNTSQLFYWIGTKLIFNGQFIFQVIVFALFF